MEAKLIIIVHSQSELQEVLEALELNTEQLKFIYSLIQTELETREG